MKRHKLNDISNQNSITLLFNYSFQLLFLWCFPPLPILFLQGVRVPHRLATAALNNFQDTRSQFIQSTWNDARCDKMYTRLTTTIHYYLRIFPYRQISPLDQSTTLFDIHCIQCSLNTCNCSTSNSNKISFLSLSHEVKHFLRHPDSKRGECIHSRAPSARSPKEITITYGNLSNASPIRLVASYKIPGATKSAFRSIRKNEPARRKSENVKQRASDGTARGCVRGWLPAAIWV